MRSSKSSGNEVAAGCIALVIAIVVIFGVIILKALLVGFALSTMWAWFVAPFFEVGQLTIARAIGFSLIMGMFTPHTVKEDDENKGVTRTLVFISPILSLLMAWIVTFFM